MKFICLGLAVLILVSCQKSGIEPPADNIVNLSFDSLQVIQANIPDDDYRDLFFINENTGLAVSNFGKIIKTTDGGFNWKNVNVPVIPGLYLENIQFTDNLTGYVLGWHNVYYSSNSWYQQSILLKTTDAGNNWTSVNVPDGKIYGMYFFDNQNGVLSGNGLLKTTNGGQTWTTVISKHFIGINFKNHNEGIITDNKGVYYETKNSGANWDSLKSTYDYSLYDIYFSASSTFALCKGAPSLIELGSNPKPLNTSCNAEMYEFLDDNKCIGIGRVYSPFGGSTVGNVLLTNNCWNTSEQKIFGESEKFAAIGKINTKKIMILGNRGPKAIVMIYKL